MPKLRHAARPLAYLAAVALTVSGIIAAIGLADAQQQGGFVTLTNAADTLDSLRWKARPVVVLADSPDDPAYRVQMAAFEAQAEALASRDIVVLSEADGSAQALRQSLGNPSGFRVVLVGKDGAIKLDEKDPLGIEQLFATIDTMPMRQSEMAARGIEG